MPPFRVYQLKITLQDTEPPIWRRVLVPGAFRLSELHRVIQSAMGWSNDHLHQFEVDGKVFGVPDGDSWQPIEPEAGVRLYSTAPGVGVEFAYRYDFGDDWLHLVTVEQILTSDGGHYPRCIGGDRRCPPEDSGGPGGYAAILEVLADPGHEDYEHLVNWLRDEDWDAEAFNIDVPNLIYQQFWS